MTNVQSTVPHARHQRSYKSNKNAHVRKVRKVKHGHALFHKILRRPSGLEGNNVVLKGTTHSLTAYNFLFRYTRSKLLHSNTITDNYSVAAFPYPQNILILSISPERI